MNLSLPIILNILVFVAIALVYIYGGIELSDMRPQHNIQDADAKQRVQEGKDILDKYLKDIEPKLGPPLEYYSI